MKTWHLLPIILLLDMSVYADWSKEVNGYQWWYKVIDGAAEIQTVWLNGGDRSTIPYLASAHLIIPTVLDGYTLTSIGAESFRSRPITGVTIPSSIRCIGSKAFQSCKNITSIFIPSSVTNIGSSAFSWCEGLSNAEIQDGVNHIGGGAFAGCGKLEDVMIPDSVVELGAQTFVNCYNLKSCNIGNGIKNIGNGLFWECTNLQAVVMGNSVTNIDFFAFQNCSALSNIRISSSTRNIGNWAFEGCCRLEGISIPDSVMSIEQGAFRYCKGLSVIEFGECVESIGNEAFLDCTNASLFAFAGAPPSVGSSAFNNVKSGAVGTYTAAHAAEWEAVIDDKGYWNGLKMKPSYYTVIYDANNGTGQTVEKTIEIWTEASVDEASFVWEEHYFMGWAFEDVGEGVSHLTPGDVLPWTPSGGETYTVHARWATVAPESANWAEGSITLAVRGVSASDFDGDPEVKYCDASGSVGEGSDWISPEEGEITTAWSDDGATLLVTDAKFSSRLDGIKPIAYRIESKTGRYAYSPATRNRRGLFVGINSYLYATNLSGCVADAQNIGKAFANYGDCGDCHYLLDSQATKKNVMDTLGILSKLVDPGDIVLFAFSGHGAKGGYLACHDSNKQAGTNISSTELAEQFVAFPKGVGLVCVIDACFSGGMIPPGEFGRAFGDDVSQCMDGLCVVDVQQRLSGEEVGWITSSQADEDSLDVNGIGKVCKYKSKFLRFSPFCVNGVDGGLFTTECICYRGWFKGRADGMGAEVYDGYVSFGELAIWGQDWMAMNYDSYRRMPDYKNFSVLVHIVAGRVPESGELALLSSPSAISTERGSDGELKVSWSAVSGAKAYNVFRSAKGSSVTNFIAVVSDLLHVDGKEIALDPNLEYEYYVRAENEDDISDASPVVGGTVAENEQLRDFVMQHMTDATIACLPATEHLPVENGSVMYSNLNYDHDGDGFTTFQEYVAGTDPANETSRLISKIVLTNEVPVVTWVPDLGDARRYKIYGKAELTDAEWQEVPPEGNPAHRFFKVGVEMP